MKKFLLLLLSAGLATQASAQSTTATTKTAAVPSAQQADAFYRQGQAAEKAGDPNAARQAYDAALKIDPSHANARFSLGQLKISSGTVAAKGREMKFGSVMIPEYRLDGATLQESVEALGVILEKQSKGQVTPNFIIQDPKGLFASAKISLTLKNTPAKAVLQYLLEQTDGKVRYDEHAIVISPK
jgi:tetratricopeptide (TPR) repeat protein